MPHVIVDGEDNDYYSLSSVTHSDDDTDESYSNTHRTCSRYAPCNKKKHLHSSTDSLTLTNRAKISKPTKGQIRLIENEPRHRQKYDGTKWRRICSVPDCSLCLNGGIYFENWLCRKHYLLTLSNDPRNQSDNSILEDLARISSQNQNTEKSSAQHISIDNESHKRGDLMVNTDGIRQKYDGHAWRPVCNYSNCVSYIVRHGYCHRHDMEMRQKNSSTPSVTGKNLHKKSKTKSEIIRTKASSALKLKKGDIQLVRQLWNGTKWYSLCHYHTRDCTRRSGGKKSGFLCDTHYKEYVEKRRDPSLIDNQDQILLSPTVKRKKIINEEPVLLSNTINGSNSAASHQSKSVNDRVEHTEQCIQTDVTFPLDSVDLREGCILVDDDDDSDRYQSESPRIMVCIKKEDDFIIHKRNMSINVNSLPFDCKLELTKLEV